MRELFMLCSIFSQDVMDRYTIEMCSPMQEQYRALHREVSHPKLEESGVDMNRTVSPECSFAVTVLPPSSSVYVQLSHIRAITQTHKLRYSGGRATQGHVFVGQIHNALSALPPSGVLVVCSPCLYLFFFSV